MCVWACVGVDVCVGLRRGNILFLSKKSVVKSMCEDNLLPGKQNPCPHVAHAQTGSRVEQEKLLLLAGIKLWPPYTRLANYNRQS